VVEVQRRCRSEFGTPPPTGVTIAVLISKFETGGTVQNVNRADLEDLSVQLTAEVVRQHTGHHTIYKEVCKAVFPRDRCP
jgi:hypothetical protein